MARESATEAPRSGGVSYSANIELDSARRSKGRSLKSLRYLWPFIARYPGWIAAFLFFLVLSTVITLTLPQLSRIAVDCGFGTGSNIPEVCERINIQGTGDLLPLFKYGMLFALIMAVVSPIRAVLISMLGERVVADIRIAVYSNLLKLSPAYYERMRTGEILSRLTTDTTLVETVVTGSISFALRGVAVAIGAVVMMFYTNVLMSLMVLGMAPLILLPVIFLGRRIRILSRDGQDMLAAASGRAGESLAAIQTVQAFTHEAEEDAAFAGDVNKNYDIQKKRILIRAIMTSIIFLVGMGGIVSIIWYGAVRVNAGEMTGGEILQFAMLAFLLITNLSALTETWTNLLRAAGASDRIVEILNAKSDIQGPENPKPINPNGDLEFDHVDFIYPSRPKDQVLKDVSFSIAPGETVAFVGPSGAGKSTLFQLMLRFYDVTGGNIQLTNTPITDADPSELREQFAIVQQGTPLFSGSAMDNIRYGRPGATDAEVIKAAKAAYADEFIRALPQGYDTDLGERALTLSGGQQQRIAIARAILKDAPILLLDEATSALDAESEHAIQKAVETLSKDRTTLIIAHRLATVKKADRLIVMEHGKIVGEGTHDELSKSGGLYARLADLQFN